MKILAYDINPVTKEKITFTSLESLLQQSDVLSLHCPLNHASRHIINQRTLALMKPYAMLINIGRGGLIDTSQLIKALKSKKLFAVDLDVYEQEENLFFDDHSEYIIEDDCLMPLMTFSNVPITAHQGFFTKEALDEILSVTLGNATALDLHNTCNNEVG